LRERLSDWGKRGERAIMPPFLLRRGGKKRKTATSQDQKKEISTIFYC